MMPGALRPGGRLLLVDEDFDDPAHRWHERFQRRHAEHRHHFDVIDPVDVAERRRQLGFASVHGSLEQVAGRPAKIAVFREIFGIIEGIPQLVTTFELDRYCTRDDERATVRDFVARAEKISSIIQERNASRSLPFPCFDMVHRAAQSVNS